MKRLSVISVILAVSILCQGCASLMVYNSSKRQDEMRRAYESINVSFRDGNYLQPIVDSNDEMIGFCYYGSEDDIRSNLSTGVNGSTPWKVIFTQPIKQAVAAIWDALCVWGAQQLIKELDKKANGD